MLALHPNGLKEKKMKAYTMKFQEEQRNSHNGYKCFVVRNDASCPATLHIGGIQ